MLANLYIIRTLTPDTKVENAAFCSTNIKPSHHPKKW